MIIQDLINDEIEYYENNPKNTYCHKKPFKTCFKLYVPDELNMVDFLKNGLLISSFHSGLQNPLKANIYKNHYEYLNKDQLNCELLEGNYTIMSRSVISGYLKKERALKLYNLLKNNENYIITLSSIEIELPFEFEFSEFTFKDNVPMYEEYKSNTLLLNEKNSGYDDDFFKQIFHIETCGFIGAVGNYENRLESIMNNGMNSNKYEDISEFDEISIMDKRWGNFNDIFFILLNSLKTV